MTTRQVSHRLAREGLRDLPELAAARRLDEHLVPGLKDAVQEGRGGFVVSHHGHLGYARCARREGELLGEVSADCYDEIDSALSREAADPAVSLHRLVAQLQR